MLIFGRRRIIMLKDNKCLNIFCHTSSVLLNGINKVNFEFREWTTYKQICKTNFNIYSPIRSKKSFPHGKSSFYDSLNKFKFPQHVPCPWPDLGINRMSVTFIWVTAYLQWTWSDINTHIGYKRKHIGDAWFRIFSGAVKVTIYN